MYINYNEYMHINEVDLSAVNITLNQNISMIRNFAWTVLVISLVILFYQSKKE